MSNLSQTNIEQSSQQLNVVQGSFRKGIIARTWGRITVWHKRRQAICELNAMSDSLLSDLGIERYQISDVVNQAGSFIKLPAVSTGSAEVTPLKEAQQAA